MSISMSPSFRQQENFAVLVAVGLCWRLWLGSWNSWSSLSARNWRAQNGRLPGLSCGVMDHFWELGEAVEMHKSREAGDGKGG